MHITGACIRIPYTCYIAEEFGHAHVRRKYSMRPMLQNKYQHWYYVAWFTITGSVYETIFYLND